jgi:Cache domain
VAQDILAADKDFELIHLLMPNGDVYFVEPYALQQNLTRNNFAFRDYFKASIETGNTYLGDLIISAASGHPHASIAVPLYSEENNNATLVGVWAGDLNFTRLSNSLRSLNLTSNDAGRIVYVDGQGQKIADSDSRLVTANTAQNESSSFANLQAFKNAINGQSGSTTEMVNDTMMLVSYYPVKAFSKTWVVLFMQPYGDGDSNAAA